jgi:hypothetical protein
LLERCSDTQLLICARVADLLLPLVALPRLVSWDEPEGCVELGALVLGFGSWLEGMLWGALLGGSAADCAAATPPARSTITLEIVVRLFTIFLLFGEGQNRTAAHAKSILTAPL